MAANTRLPAAYGPVSVSAWTAAAELLPATIEADYQGLPLILISADRPRRYRGSGAPQTIGTHVSSGCIRLTNQDVTDLYSRVNVGTRVIVLLMERRAENSPAKNSPAKRSQTVVRVASSQ